MRLGKKELYETLKSLNIITNQKCKDFESTTFKNSHWLNGNDLKIWANGLNYIVAYFYYYNEEGDKIKTKEITLRRIEGEWTKYYERAY